MKDAPEIEEIPDPPAEESDQDSNVDGDEDKDGDCDEDKDGDSSGSDASDSSDSTEKCPICLLSFHDQEVGSPNVCEHVFCVPCIEVWSRSVKTCPIDRHTFTGINVFKNFDDRTALRTISVDSNSNKELVLDEADGEDDLTMCEICNRADREEVLLLCDGCNRGYHTDCLTPALAEVPHGSWYCDNCFSSHTSSSSDEGEITDLLNELESVGGSLMELGRLRHQPRITRTRQSERIRNTILSTTGRRTQVASTSRQAVDQPSTSRSTTSTVVRSAAKPRVVRKKRRKKYKRRTRTVVVEYDLNSDSKFPVATKKVKIVRRRRKRRVKRKAKTCKTTTSRSRSSKSGTASSSKDISEVGASGRRATKSFLPAFTLMGPKRDMDVLFSDSEEDEAYTRAINSGSTLMLSIREARQSRNLLQVKSQVAATTASSSYVTSPNLLDSIMQSMDGLRGKSEVEKIVRKATISATATNGDDTTPSTVPVKEPQGETTSSSTHEEPNQVSSGGGEGDKPESSQSSAAPRENSNGKEEAEDAEPVATPPKDEKKPTKDEGDEKKLSDFSLPTLDSLPTVQKSTFKYDDDDSDNDCPNFSVYSEETMALLAKGEGNPTEMSENDGTDCYSAPVQQDFDEDLVQMSDNDENLQDAGEMVLNQSAVEESYDNQEAGTPTQDERYPDDTEIKSPDTNEAYTPPLRPQAVEPEEIQSPDQEMVDEEPRRVDKTSRRTRRRHRDSSPEHDKDESDESPKKKRRKDRKTDKKEPRKRSPSRTRRMRSRERDKKRNRRSPSRSPAHRRNRRSRSRPRNRRSRSRSLSHRWSPVQRRTRTKSRSFTPPLPAPIDSRKDKTKVAASKRSTATTKPKDVFKSGKNILVSVNFEKNNKFEYSNDPVAIIDLTNGVQETIPSAKNIIEVSDSEHEEEKVPDNSLIGAVKATIESKLKATAPPKVKPTPVGVPPPQQSGESSSVHTDRLLSQIKTAFVDSAKRGGTSIVPEKPSKVLALPAATSDSPEITSGYDYLPYSPGSSDYDDMFDDHMPDAAAASDGSMPAGQDQQQPTTSAKAAGGGDKVAKNIFNDLFGQSPVEGEQGAPKAAKPRTTDKKATKEKYISKLNMQKRASDEAKLYLKPFYNSKQITKDDYKDILRRAVPKICKGGEIKPQKIESLIAAYVRTIRHKSKKSAKK